MNNHTTNPSEGVSNQSSETSINNDEDLIKHLEGMRVDWKLDLNDLISLIKEQKIEWWTSDMYHHILNQVDDIMESKGIQEWVNYYDLSEIIYSRIELTRTSDSIDFYCDYSEIILDLIRRWIYRDLLEQSRIVQLYLDKGVV